MIVGGSEDTARAVLDPSRLRKEVLAFLQKEGTSLAVVILHVGDSPYEEFVVEPGSVPGRAGTLAGIV